MLQDNHGSPKLLAPYGFLHSPKGLNFSIQLTVKCVQSGFCSSQFVCNILVASFLFIIVGGGGETKDMYLFDISMI